MSVQGDRTEVVGSLSEHRIQLVKALAGSVLAPKPARAFKLRTCAQDVAVRPRNLQALGRYPSIESSAFCIVAIAAFNAVTNNCSLMSGSRSRPFTMRAA